ncbi:MAG: 6-hydroxycyclohex-1-ene-1-carbonyl-CoA dehydrogenase [Planctomycetes bacterium]|nr:6-hydroxycyclohex-1-ene-1-carbonyl-CoA dehydrogenase [Planctomycetota bacterium]
MAVCSFRPEAGRCPSHTREHALRITGWALFAPKEPMATVQREEALAVGDVLVEVAGCGVCHTDLAFSHEGVPTRHPLPLTLGHEISGRVVDAGAGAESWCGRAVVVPAVIPCGECRACRAGRGSICPRQVFPGNDVHGGFATHVRVPARGLCPVPDLGDRSRNPLGLDLASLSVVADAVSTPYQAIERAGVRAGDVAVFVGAGGVGGFGIQIAAAHGAHVVAIDIDERRLTEMKAHGASLCMPSGDARELKKALTAFAKERDVPTWRTFVFETSGTSSGQATAFALLGHGGFLSVVGYTPDKVELRLSNLMALDATAQGNWGCLPEHYPAVVELVLSGAVRVQPFVEHRPLSTINQTFAEIHARKVSRRVVLVPGS